MEILKHKAVQHGRLRPNVTESDVERCASVVNINRNKQRNIESIGTECCIYFHETCRGVVLARSHQGVHFVSLHSLCFGEKEDQ